MSISNGTNKKEIILDKTSSQFLLRLIPGSEDALEAYKSFPKIKEELQVLLNKCKHNAGSDDFIIFLDKPQCTDFFHPKYLVYAALYTIQQKIMKMHHKYYLDEIDIIKNLILYLEYNCTPKSPLSFFVEAFSQFISDKYNEIIGKHIHSARFLYRHYCENHWPDLIPTIPLEAVRNALLEAEKQVELSTEYVPFTFFDEIFLAYLNSKTSNNHFTLFEETSSEILSVYKGESSFLTPIQSQSVPNFSEISMIPENDTEISDLLEIPIPKIKTQKAGKLDFAQMNKKTAPAAIEIGPHSIEQNRVLRCAIVRIVFDCIIQQEPDLLSIGIDQIYINNCHTIAASTPRQLKFNKNTLKPEQMEMTINQLVKSNKLLQDALESFFSIIFYNNPLDISYCLFFGLKAIESFVKEQTSAKVVSEMSFDDFFAFFYSIMAINPPANATGIAKFLMCIEHFKLSDAFDFAKLLFTSAVDFTQKFGLEILEIEEPVV